MTNGKIIIGDRVSHPNRPRSHQDGRVTGFAPNGHARVKLDNGQSRIWPTDNLLLHYDQFDHIKDWRLHGELCAFVQRIGIDRAAWLANAL